MNIMTSQPADIESIEATRIRLDQFAEWTGTKAPKTILDKDGAPTTKLLAYSAKEHLNLDWLFCGDVKILTLAERRRQDAWFNATKFDDRFARLGSLLNALRILSWELSQESSSKPLNTKLRSALVGVIEAASTQEKKATKAYMAAHAA